MQKLKQYVDLIKQFKVKKQEVTALLGDDTTKLHRFFDGLAARRWKADEDAIVRELYGEQLDTRHGPYRALKAELKKKLRNLLFLMDFHQPDVLNDVQEAHYDSLRTCAAVKILSGRGKSDAGIDMCQHLLENALKFDLTEAVMTAAKHLQTHYRIKQPNVKKYNYYRNLYLQHLDYYRVESLSENFYTDIIGNYINNRSTKKWVQATVKDYVEQLLPHKGQVKTGQFLWFFGMLELMFHMVVNDYTSTLAICEDYIDQLEKKPYLHKSALVVFYHQKTVCHLMLRQHEEGFKAALKASTWVIHGSHNWFKDRTIFLQLCLHARRNKTAMKVCIEVLKHEDFKNQIESVQQELKIYEAYIQWLVKVGKIKANDVEQEQIGSFRINRLLNEVPVCALDKRGLNIPVLLLQILSVTGEKDDEGFYLRLEALNQYRTRHFKDDDNARTNLLIKLLNTAYELGFDKAKIKKRTATTYKKLVETTYNFDGTHETEVFAYDIYWLYILEMLEPIENVTEIFADEDAMVLI